MTISLDGKTNSFCDFGHTMLERRKKLENLKYIGAIYTEFITKKGTLSDWNYYISSRQLTAEELLHHARMEWSVESIRIHIDFNLILWYNK
jgi:hypothetical protein